MEQVRATYKARDSWWTVLLVDPAVGPLVRVAAARAWITPNRLTMIAFLLGLVAAVSFLQATPGWLVTGALLYHAGFMIDCMDGKVARLQGSGSVFGGWLDFFLDRVRVVLCVVALFAGQWMRTDDAIFLFAATGVVFLALFGYVNGAETDKARARLVSDRGALDDGTLLAEVAGPAAGLTHRLRTALHRRRIRMNLISGIELEMAVLVVAPLTVVPAGAYTLIWVTGVAAVLLVAFELALIVRFWLALRSADPPGPTAGNDGMPISMSNVSIPKADTSLPRQHADRAPEHL